MAHQFLNDGEEKEVRSTSANEPERHEDSREDVAADETSARANESTEQLEEGTTSASPRRQRRGKSERVQAEASETDAADRVDAAEAAEATIRSPEDDLLELAELGFTADEATRLMEVAERRTHSDEVRDAEAMLNRLQFTKWLIERGVLDEFSLRD